MLASLYFKVTPKQTYGYRISARSVEFPITYYQLTRINWTTYFDFQSYITEFIEKNKHHLYLSISSCQSLAVNL